MSKEPEITLKDIHEDFMELIKWIKFSSIEEIKPKLKSILDTDEKKTTYQQSDGKSRNEIAKIANISDRTVSNYWNLWNQSGLTKSKTFSGGPRQIRIFDLVDFNLLPKSVENNPNGVEKSNE